MIELTPGGPSSVGVSPEKLFHLENLCAGWVSAGKSPAVSVLAARQGTIFLHNAWGQLSPDPLSPLVGPDSLFGLASCSKPVTATAVMILVEDGRMELDHPVQLFLPRFAGPGCEKITFRQLLNHTSGLPVDTDAEDTAEIASQLVFEPGSRMVYSSVGYDLLGKAVEKLSGRAFEDFVRLRIFDPLGMENSSFVHLGSDRTRCVLRRPGTTYDWPEEFAGQVSASSTLWSTALDMGIFLQTFLNQGRYGDFQLLSREGVREMTRDQTPGVSREKVDGVPIPAAGLGWFLLGSARFSDYPRSFSRESYGHSGASGAFIWVDPAFDLIGAFLFVKIKEDFRPLKVFVDGLRDCITDG